MHFSFPAHCFSEASFDGQNQCSRAPCPKKPLAAPPIMQCFRSPLPFRRRRSSSREKSRDAHRCRLTQLLRSVPHISQLFLPRTSFLRLHPIDLRFLIPTHVHAADSSGQRRSPPDPHPTPTLERRDQSLNHADASGHTRTHTRGRMEATFHACV